MSEENVAEDPYIYTLQSFTHLPLRIESVWFQKEAIFKKMILKEKYCLVYNKYLLICIFILPLIETEGLPIKYIYNNNSSLNSPNVS